MKWAWRIAWMICSANIAVFLWLTMGTQMPQSTQTFFETWGLLPAWVALGVVDLIALIQWIHAKITAREERQEG